jgi:DNA-binding FadR family transcriptional regulator
VLDPMASFSPEVLRAMLAPQAGRVDPDVLADFLEVRAALDVQMTMLAAERRTDEDLAQLDAAIAKLAAALHDRARYDREALVFPRMLARATHNGIFEMLVWWHQSVAIELASIFSVVRPANEAHLQGHTLLVELVRKREVEQVRTLVTAFHAWATPRMLAAAALSSGAPLSRVMEGTVR